MGHRRDHARRKPAVHTRWRRPVMAVIDEALASALRTVPQLLAFRVVQLAMEARPHEAVELGQSADSSQLSALAATILACGMAVAPGTSANPTLPP